MRAIRTKAKVKFISSAKSIHFTDIYRQINNNSILHTESDSDVNQGTSSGKGKSMAPMLIET